MKYRIADTIVEMDAIFKIKSQAIKYLYSTDKPADIKVNIPDIEAYNKRQPDYTYESFCYMLSGSDFYKKLLDFGGMMLHASAVAVEDKAYLFSAASGTGKSTHTQLWLEKFGNSAYIINDDKPAIRYVDGELYVYGTPWSGKTDLNVNSRAKLQGICFLQRDERNWIRRQSAEESIERIMHGSLKRLTVPQLKKQIDIIKNIIENVPIFTMGCTPTPDAAEMSYNAMKNKQLL